MSWPEWKNTTRNRRGIAGTGGTGDVQPEVSIQQDKEGGGGTGIEFESAKTRNKKSPETGEGRRQKRRRKGGCAEAHGSREMKNSR